MIEYQDGEMTDSSLRSNFSDLVNRAVHAFSIDSNYTTELILKAQAIQAKQGRKLNTVE